MEQNMILVMIGQYAVCKLLLNPKSIQKNKDSFSGIYEREKVNWRTAVTVMFNSFWKLSGLKKFLWY